MKRLALLLLVPAAACSARETDDSPSRRVTLTNRSGAPVSGALLRFDRELVRADRLAGFARVQLRMAPANTLRVEGAPLGKGAQAVYEVEGAGGPPQLLEGRWLRNGKLGKALTKDEFAVR